MAKADILLEKQIAEHLAPILTEMDLKFAYERDEQMRAVMDIVPREADGWRSPVKIIFDDVEGEDLRWDQAHLEIETWGCRELGETGWVSWKWFDTARHEIRGEGPQALDWLKSVIEHNGIVPGESAGPKFIVNSNFGDLYVHAARLFPDLEIIQSNRPKSSYPRECFMLKDKRGREIEIGMRKNDFVATVYIDGTYLTGFNQRDHIRFREIIRDLSEVEPEAQMPSR